HLTSFLIVLPRPPLPTPFPYTTLFRSLRCAVFRSPQPFPRPREELFAHCNRSLGYENLERRRSLFQPRSRAGRAPFGADRTRRIDRKSTRLNSSHEWISYAVFCLKKKR